MTKTVNVGIVGLGTVGSGVVEIIKKNGAQIKKKTGVKLNLVKICSRSNRNCKKLGIKPQQFTKNYDDLLKNKDIDVIIELIGGYEPARTFILKAIKAKKHVITANKAVLAKYGYEIYNAAQKNGVNVLFEAAVGGCIPIIRTIEETYPSAAFQEVYGILNGTSNYILTRMSEGMGYPEALKKAQDLGFAEADPSFDVDGDDAAQKIAITASLAFGAQIKQQGFTQGITRITAQDLAYANELGYAIKLIAMAKNKNSEIELRTHATMIPKDHVLASINNEVNGVFMKSKDIGDVVLVGAGAGKIPTATVVVSDIIEMGSRTRVAERHFAKAKIKPVSKIKTRYYIRFSVVDKPGVLAKITKILGDNKISIAAFSQKEHKKAKVPIIILTQESVEENIVKAVKACNKLPIVKDDGVIIRIEDL